MGPGPAVELDRLSKSFRVRRSRGRGLSSRVRDYVRPRTEDVVAVDRLSFTIAPGERVAFIGPNGAGKSTTLKMLAGVLKPDTGVARVLGLDPSRQRRRLAFQLGTVFGQRSQLWYQLPPRDTFALLGRVYEVDRVAHQQRVDALTALFALGAFIDTPVRQLSLGERMRCEIAASLLHRPRLLFLDEPTIGLDVSAKATIQALLRAESERDGVTLLLTSHDTADMEKICDRVIVIHGGRLLWDGGLGDLRRRYLTTKRVTVWSESEDFALARPGVRTISSAGYRTELEVALDVTSVGAVVDAIVRLGPVRDLVIEDAPLETVIRALYAGGVRAGECVMTGGLFKYAAFARIAAAQARRSRGELYGRIAFFVVILGVFSSLWRAVAESGMPLAADERSLVWYLAITEWIVLSVPLVHVDIQEAVRRGDVVCQIGRPVSYVGATFAEGLGLIAVRAPSLLLTACACAFAFTGWWPPIAVLAAVVPFGLVAMALIVALLIGVGLLAFWLGDISPVFLVWQKSLFVFGGLMMPLELYPAVIRRIAAFTPFPSVLTGPASLVLRSNLAGAGLVARDLALWAVLIAVALTVVSRRATTSLAANGG